MSLDIDLESLKAAASGGDVAAKVTLAKHMIAMPTSVKSFEDGRLLLNQAYDMGNGEAAEFLAIMQAAGLRCEQDWSQALDYLIKAAQLGWKPASQQLAIFADAGNGNAMEVSTDKDIESLRKKINIQTLLRIPEKHILSEAPRIRKVENLIPPRFCDWIIAKARPNLSRARTYDSIFASGRENQTRTNSSVSFSILELDLILLLFQTLVSKIADVPMFTMENSSVLHYEIGQQFRPHYDYLDPLKPAHAADIKRFGQRLATCLIYLNDDFEGAETSFPKINLKFRCNKGGALLFANVDERGLPDPNTLHAGLPPSRGEKWLFSQWIRTGPLPENA